jgi:hypothetical protein
MKATTKLAIPVLAVALCAAVALPITAMAKPASPADSLGAMTRIDPSALELAQPAEPVHIIGSARLVGNLELVEIAESGDAVLGDPPVAPADDAAAEGVPGITDPTHAPEVPSMVITQSVETTPPPVFVREPDLPFTGGDASPFMFAGFAAILAGAILVTWTSLRKAGSR